VVVEYRKGEMYGQIGLIEDANSKVTGGKKMLYSVNST
jgi:hypothetical protein